MAQAKILLFFITKPKGSEFSEISNSQVNGAKAEAELAYSLQAAKVKYGRNAINTSHSSLAI